MGAPARVYHGLRRMARAGNGLLLHIYNTLLANDLTGLQRVFGAGLYAGLGGRFWGPCWPDLGPCWGFARGGALRVARDAGRGTTTIQTMLSGGAFAPFWCGRFNGPTTRFSVWLGPWPRLALLGALLGLLGALAGLCCGLRAAGRACDAYFHCTKPQCWACIQYGLA